MAGVSIIGSGNVGANAAFFIAEKGVTDVLMVDIATGLSRGKALDVMEAAPIRRYRNTISGSDSLEDIRGSPVIVVAAGAIRAPGMRREELYGANAGLIRDLAPRIARLAPDATVLMATEPVDGLTTLFVRASGMPRTRVLGLGGVLDSTRLRALIALELQVSSEIVSAMVIGRHSDDMVCLPRYCSVSGVPLPLLLPQPRIASLVEQTRSAGDLVVELAKRSTAYYAPSAAIAEIADSIHMDLKRVFSLSILLQGEYGCQDAALSLPVVIGEKGAARVLTPELLVDEVAVLRKSAKLIADVVGQEPRRASEGGVG
ncbi:MAG TPA: malate dehydrogenase [Spirochaetia bacterium]|nr:malate dehydrogenase [Spirochaetia bacterium]